LQVIGSIAKPAKVIAGVIVAKEVIMPKLALTMTKGTIVKWMKKEGEDVEKGEALFEVETDKIVNEIEASASGTLRRSGHQPNGEAEIRVRRNGKTPGGSQGSVRSVSSGWAGSLSKPLLHVHECSWNNDCIAVDPLRC
jgi:hypothetical protein